MTKKTLDKKIIYLFILLSGCYIFKAGPYESFYKNGQVKKSGFYESGRKNGIFRSYSKDGNLISEESFLNGKLHGKSIWFTKTGIPHIIGLFQNGVKSSFFIAKSIRLPERSE